MSKPIARVALVTLIGIVLIAAAYPTVQGAFAKADTATAGVQTHNVSGLQTNFNHDRSTVSELDALQAQNNTFSDPGAARHEGGGCRDKQQSVPLD